MLLRVSASRQLIFLLVVALSAGCSVPNLETPRCVEAKTRVREFYSFHFANDMVFSTENLEKRKGFLTRELYDRLNGQAPDVDPFTQTSDLPKAFRVGECTETTSGVQFDVLLFWKTDTRTEQRSIKVDAEKVGDEWYVAKVGS